MKLPVLLLVLAALAVPSTVLSQSAESRWGATARFHAGHKELQDVPYDGDWSYGLLYEYREPQAYFQLGLSYAPSISFLGEFEGSADPIEAVWTPEFNLMFTHGTLAAGLGVLKHQVRRENDSEWSSFFYQFLTEFTLGQRAGIGLNLAACYEFSSWGNIKDIDIKDVDVRISLTRAF